MTRNVHTSVAGVAGELDEKMNEIPGPEVIEETLVFDKTCKRVPGTSRELHYSN